MKVKFLLFLLVFILALIVSYIHYSAVWQLNEIVFLAKDTKYDLLFNGDYYFRIHLIFLKGYICFVGICAWNLLMFIVLERYGLPSSGKSDGWFRKKISYKGFTVLVASVVVVVSCIFCLQLRAVIHYQDAILGKIDLNYSSFNDLPIVLSSIVFPLVALIVFLFGIQRMNFRLLFINSALLSSQLCITSALATTVFLEYQRLGEYLSWGIP